MEREDFLKKLGIGLVAVCAGCSLASCGGSKTGDPAPSTTTTTGGGGGGGTTGGGGGTTGGGGGTTGGSNLFTADLTTEITNVGDTKSSGGVILLRIATGNTASSFSAVTQTCTHAGGTIAYNKAQGIFICPLHDSHFSNSGAVVQGPATRALTAYAITITGTTLTVSS